MNLLITGAYNCTDDDLQTLKSLNNEIVFHKMESDPLPCDYAWAEGVVCNGLFLHHDIKKFSNLKYIQLTSAGFDRVDMEYIHKKGIEIHNARGVYSVPMAEFALCGVLDLYKQSRFFYKNQKQHKWDKHRGLLELYGKTVCIVGCGNVGLECAKRFKAFDTTLLGVDIKKPDSDIFDKYFSLENMSSALRVSDIVVLTLPLTNETKNMFNSKVFAFFKENAILVNISRGGVVNQADLVNALETKKIFGAVLDVFENEPLENDSPLWNMENVIITPHNSFVGENNANRLRSVIFNNLNQR